MFDQWERVQERFDQINNELASATLQASKRHGLQKELSVLTALLEQYKKLTSFQQEIDEIEQQIKQTDDAEMLELFNDDLVIKNGVVIPAHELNITTSRAGGPGGQHVNKADTRVTIHWNIANSKALTEIQKERLLDKLEPQLTDEGDIVVHNGSTRSQLQNRKLAYQQLVQKIRKALHVPKKRMKTRISKAVKEKRLQEKKQRSELKKLRQKKSF